MKLSIDEIVTLRDCVSEDIVEREKQIKSGFTTEQIDRPIIENRKVLREKINKYILKYHITGNL